jgi:exosortase A-associated hydrolase 1
MKFAERAVLFDCAGEVLVGVLAQPERAEPVGVLVIVGGPQYRVGAHRQFVLLARFLAEQGHATLRFDYRGMGDSSGAPRSFDGVDLDIGCAIDTFQKACPGVGRFVLWGLCDGASAAMMYAWRDPRVVGYVLVNPWARSETTQAKTQLRHYYVARFLEQSFWKKVLQGGLHWRATVGALLGAARNAVAADIAPTGDFRQRMLHGARQFRGAGLVILSGADLTAKEFLEHARMEPGWDALLASRFSRVELPNADHTLSGTDDRLAVEEATLNLLRRLSPG